MPEYEQEHTNKLNFKNKLKEFIHVHSERETNDQFTGEMRWQLWQPDNSDNL